MSLLASRRWEAASARGDVGGRAALGAGARDEAAALGGHALVLAVLLGCAFGLGAWFGVGALFRVMGASGAVHDGATVFARVLFGGVCITFFSMMLDSLMRAEGNVRVPAMWATTSLLLQMAVTPLFMFRFGWGLSAVRSRCSRVRRSRSSRASRGSLGDAGGPPGPHEDLGPGPLREIVRVGIRPRSRPRSTTSASWC